jgi:hypothetical protein
MHVKCFGLFYVIFSTYKGWKLYIIWHVQRYVDRTYVIFITYKRMFCQ